MPTLADLQNQRQQFFKQKGEQAQGQIQGQTQGNVGALQRRFTAMGAANTGAALAAEQTARNEGLEQQRQAQTDLAGQQLQAGEGDIGRAFQSEEARVARDAQLGEAEKGRGFQRELSQQDLKFKQGLADTEQSNKMKELDLAEKQFLIDKDTTKYNQQLSAIQAGLWIDSDGKVLGTLADKAARDQEAEMARRRAALPEGFAERRTNQQAQPTMAVNPFTGNRSLVQQQPVYNPVEYELGY